MRQKREQIPAGTLLLAVEDPEMRVGSGGATLNALLVAAEHLSARAGFTVSAHEVPSSGTCPGQNGDAGFKQIVSEVTLLLGLHCLASSAFGISFCACRLGRFIRRGQKAGPGFLVVLEHWSQYLRIGLSGVS